jgi:predicted nucleotidyltransferase
MVVVDASRLAEYRRVVSAVGSWARGRVDVRAVAVVGSWARDEARMDSDVDLIVLTDDTARCLADDGWICEALGRPVTVVRRQAWGAVTERRARLASGLQVEFGLATPAWASTDPVDTGTARVVRDGCVAVVDRDGLLARLTAAVGRPTGP